MSKHDLDKAFVSVYDKFMAKFDQEHEKTRSQQKEIDKYRRIAALRDNPNSVENTSEIWSEF